MKEKEEKLKEEKVIEEIIALEEQSHFKSKEYSRAYSKRIKLLKKFTVPENKLLKELENRKLELKQELLKIKRDIQHEKHLEFKRKKSYRETIPELIENKKEVNRINAEHSKLYEQLNEFGKKYPELYSKAWDLYKQKREREAVI